MVDRDATRWVDSMPGAYERYLVPTVFAPFAADLSRRVAAHAPGRVLELAAGTGVLTRELVGVAGEVVATDLNPAMVDLGRQQVPGASWRQADAMALPFPDGVFDLVACSFGVMFLPDKPAAAAEARRVLAPEGVLLLTTWAGVAAHTFAAALQAALETVFPADPPRFVASVPHGYADPGVAAADLATGGFGPVRVEEVTLVGRAASARDVALGFCTGTPLRAELVARGDLGACTERVAAEMTARLGPGPVSGPMTAYVLEAPA